MKKLLIFGGFFLVFMSLVSMVSAEEQEYISLPSQLYDFIHNYQGTEQELLIDLDNMCVNAEFRPYYEDWSVLWFDSYGLNYGIHSGWTKVWCKIKKQRIDGGNTYSSLFTAYYKITDEEILTEVDGYYINPYYGRVTRNTRFKANLPLPLE